MVRDHKMRSKVKGVDWCCTIRQTLWKWHFSLRTKHCDYPHFSHSIGSEASVWNSNEKKQDIMIIPSNSSSNMCSYENSFVCVESEPLISQA
jgi:hypothetical protein